MQKRFLSYTSKTFMRSKASGGGMRGSLATPGFSKISSNFDHDGLHRYEIDWFETAEWTKNLLESMKKDASELAKYKNISTAADSNDATNNAKKKTAAAIFNPPSVKTPLCIQKTLSFTYDFSVPESERNPVTLHIKTSDLGLSHPGQVHKLKLLAGTLYDPHTDVISLSRNDEGYSYDENIVILGEIMNNLVKEAKNTEDTFADIPLDLRYAESKTLGLEFPSSWIKAAKKKMITESKQSILSADPFSNSSSTSSTLPQSSS